jgi:hypothetical protein
MQPQNIIWVVAGKQYRTDKSTLVAHNAYWNGYNCEQGGRNTFLFKTTKGNFFAQYQSLLPGEINKITPLGINESLSLYQSLQKKEVPFRVVFPCIKAEDA